MVQSPKDGNDTRVQEGPAASSNALSLGSQETLQEGKRESKATGVFSGGNYN